ncbi:9515_t:CDS:2, partial [Ambispora leptoticha]
MSTSVKTELVYEEPSLINIEDLDDKRLIALHQIDTVNFSWFHIRTCIVSGIGFFTDAYDLFVINLVSAMLGVAYFDNSVVPNDVDLGLKVSAAVGTLFGQLLFGIMADRYGRKQMYGFELLIMIICTIGQILAGSSYAVTVHGTIIFWRFFLGLGIGGDYPMSA